MKKAILGFLTLAFVFLLSGSISHAATEAKLTTNPDSLPDENATEYAPLGSTGSIHLFAVNTSGNDDDPSYSGYMAGAISFDTDSKNALYRYTYVNHAGTDVVFALYSYDNGGTPVEADYTAQSIRPGEAYTDVIKLQYSKRYYFLVYASNSESLGTRLSNSIASVSITSLLDDVGDTIALAKDINVSTTYESNIQGRPDTDCFKLASSPGTALALTVQNRSTAQNDEITVRFADRYGNELMNFSIAPGAIYTQEAWELQNKEAHYVMISAPYSSNATPYSLRLDPVVRRIEYVLGSTSASNGGNPYIWNVGQTFKLKDGARPNYIFKGWFTDEDFSEDSKVTSVTEAITEDITLYAKWQKFSVKAPTKLKYKTYKNKIVVSFKKAKNATKTIISCNGKTYKTVGTKITIKKLKAKKSYKVKVWSEWTNAGNTTKSSTVSKAIKTKAK